MPFAALCTMLAETPRVPRTVQDLILRSNVQELTVILGTLALRKEVTQGHACEIVLMQIFAEVTLLALAAEPVLTYVCSSCA